MMKSYLCKITLKERKPPYWWRIHIPSGISFSSLSVLLDLLIDAKDSGPFDFEVHQFARVWEPTAAEPLTAGFSCSAYDAAHTAIDLLFAVGKPINYRRGGEVYQIRVESIDEQYPFAYPLVVKSPKGTDTNAAIKKMQDSFEVQQRIIKRPKNKEQLLSQAKNGLCRVPMIEIALREDSPYYKKSGDLMIQEIADRLKEMIPDFEKFMEKEVADLSASRRETFKLWEILDFYNREELNEIAQAQGIVIDCKKSKQETAKLVAEKLLEEDRLYRHFISLTDEETSAFEELRAAGGLMRISHERWELFSALSDAGYVFYSDRDEIITGTDVMKAYQRISTHEFHALRKKVSYIRQCLNFVVPRYYSLIPLRKFSRVARREKEPKIEAAEVKQLIEKIPENMHECVIRDDTIYAEQLIQDPDIMEYVRDVQRDKPYCIMRENEIDEVLRYGYPQSNRAYRAFREYMLANTKMDARKADRLLIRVHQAIALSWRVQKFFEILDEFGFIPTEAQAEELMKLYMPMSSNTHTLYNRGYTPLEMKRVSGKDDVTRIGIDNAQISVRKK